MREENQSRQQQEGNQERDQPPFLLLAQEPEDFFANLTHKSIYPTDARTRKPFRHSLSLEPRLQCRPRQLSGCFTPQPAVIFQLPLHVLVQLRLVVVVI